MKKAPKKFVKTLQKKTTARMGMKKAGPKRHRIRKKKEGDAQDEDEDEAGDMEDGEKKEESPFVTTKIPIARVETTSVTNGYKSAKKGTLTVGGLTQCGRGGKSPLSRGKRPARAADPLFGSHMKSGATFTPPGNLIYKDSKSIRFEDA